MTNGYFVAAYTTSPSGTPFGNEWNPDIEKEYFHCLAKQSEIIGIEHPLYLNNEKYPLAWLVTNIPSHWSMMITTLPIFMAEAKCNVFFGLASQREQDRSLAMKMMEQICHDVHQLNHALGRNVVKAIHFHALPKNDATEFRGSKTALKKSLYELKNLDWGQAHLNLEHCDAYVPNQIAEKGFLTLEDEIEVLTEVGDVWLVLNWGRSAIEGRSITTPLQHIKMAKAAKLLKGFFFSGCTDDPSSDYGAWKDLHIPPKNIIKSKYLREESLLGAEEIQQTFSLLDPDMYLGIKVLDAAKQKTLEKSVGLNIDTIRALESVR